MLSKLWTAAIHLGGCLIIGIVLIGCSDSSLRVHTSSASAEMFIPSLLSRLNQGDRHVGWALTYYKSWQRDHQPRYLFLAEDHIFNAIDQFAHLQSDTSPRIGEFYVIRERRVRSCRLLAELQFSATNYGMALRRPPATGCVF
ncbi:MAG: hypothetical protein HQM14_03390 [SAR324 cluster bacterium]|nr:hypothetical protein [SAR324 cluster bacterium]